MLREGTNQPRLHTQRAMEHLIPSIQNPIRGLIPLKRNPMAKNRGLTARSPTESHNQLIHTRNQTLMTRNQLPIRNQPTLLRNIKKRVTEKVTAKLNPNTERGDTEEGTRKLVTPRRDMEREHIPRELMERELMERKTITSTKSLLTLKRKHTMITE